MRSLKKCFVELEPSLSLSLSRADTERGTVYFYVRDAYQDSVGAARSSSRPLVAGQFGDFLVVEKNLLLFSLLFVFAAWTSPKKNGTTLPLDQVQARIFDPLLSDFSSGENFSSTINYIIIVFDCASYFVIY